MFMNTHSRTYWLRVFSFIYKIRYPIVFNDVMYCEISGSCYWKHWNTGQVATKKVNSKRSSHYPDHVIVVVVHNTTTVQKNEKLSFHCHFGSTKFYSHCHKMSSNEYLEIIIRVTAACSTYCNKCWVEEKVLRTLRLQTTKITFYYIEGEQGHIITRTIKCFCFSLLTFIHWLNKIFIAFNRNENYWSHILNGYCLRVFLSYTSEAQE